MKKRLSTLLLMGLVLGIALPSRAQLLAKAQTSPTRSVQTEQEKIRKLKDVLNDLKKQYHVDILFFGKNIENYKVPAESYNPSVPLEKNLDMLLSPLNLNFKKSGRGGYVITEKGSNQTTPKQEIASVENQTLAILGKRIAPANNTLSATTNGVEVLAEKIITGKVTTADDNEPLPGVSILIKGLQRGTTTDVKGTFLLSIPDDNTTLVFSFVGYKSQEVVVGNRSTLAISLETDNNALEEVVVVGYGTQKKVNVIGSISQITSDNIENRPVTQASQAITGQMPGVTVTQSTDGTFYTPANNLLTRPLPYCRLGTIPELIPEAHKPKQAKKI